MSVRAQVLLAVVAVAACGCASRPASSYVPPPPAPPVYLAPPVPVEAPEPETSGFDDAADQAAAEAAIEQSEAAYQAVQADVAAFTARQPVACGSPVMEGAIERLRPINNLATRYLTLATTAAAPPDREAAMDVLDEVNKALLDGLLDIARGYRSARCYFQAKSLLTDARRVFSGAAYAGWTGEFGRELALIEAAQRAATPAAAARVSKGSGIAVPSGSAKPPVAKASQASKSK